MNDLFFGDIKGIMNVLQYMHDKAKKSKDQDVKDAYMDCCNKLGEFLG